MLNLHKKYTLYCMFLSTGFLEKNCFLKRKNKKIKIKIVKLRNHFTISIFMSKAKLIYKQKELDLNVIEGSEKEKAIDITTLRSQTGLITMDPGYGNTGSCISNITFIDGEKGILRYRGYPIENLAGKVNFTDTAYLLLNGELQVAMRSPNPDNPLNVFV